jgi:hypothetical protein
MIASNMEVIANELWNELCIFVASATRALKNLLRQCRRSSWFPLLAVAGGALLGIVAIKLIALLGGAFGISLLRDVGNNAGPGAAAGAAGAGAAAGAAGGGGNPPDPPPWWKGPFYGPPNPDGSPVRGTHPPFVPAPWWDPISGRPMLWFSHYVQAAAFAIIPPEKGSSGNAGGKA